MEAAVQTIESLPTEKPITCRTKQDMISIFRLLTVSRSNLELAIEYSKRTIKKLNSIRKDE